MGYFTKNKSSCACFTVVSVVAYVLFFVLLFPPMPAMSAVENVDMCLSNIKTYQMPYNNIIPQYKNTCNVHVFTDAVVGVDAFYMDGDKEIVRAVWQVTDAGVVMKGDLGSFTVAMLEGLQSIEHKKLLIMQYVPGSYDDEGLREALLTVRDMRYATRVPRAGEISSGGVDFFISGLTRSAEKGARIGVHSWQDDTGKTARDYPKNSPVHTPYLRLYKTMGIPQDFYWFTLRKGASNDMYWMSDAEIRKFLL